MAVSDVFTALTENRPYRMGMDRSSTQKVLLGMVSQSALDPDIVNLLLSNFDELNAVRADAQTEAVAEFGEICGKVAMMAAGQA
jgi:HD-GYP domain-containing protein (c-di-GMP phosphodiesterase class II)